MALELHSHIPPQYTFPEYIPSDEVISPKSAQGGGKNAHYYFKPYRILRDIAHISSGYHHNLAIDHRGELWEWGALKKISPDGWYHPDAPQEVNYVPQKVMDNASIADAGAAYTMCISKDKKLWGWGENKYGQLGVGDFEKRDTPVLVMEDVKSVLATEYQTFAIKTDGSLWGWGDNSENHILLGAPEVCPTPVHLMDHVMEISAGPEIAVVVKEDNTLWAWGGAASRFIFGEPTRIIERGPELLLTGIATASVSKYDLCSWCLATTLTGDLYSLGGSVGAIGSLVSPIPKASPYRNVTPVKVMQNAAKTRSGNDFSLIQMTDGRLFGGGDNSLGQCGDGKSSGTRYKPVQIMTHVVEVAAGWNYGMALQRNGDLWIWGGDYGIER